MYCVGVEFAATDIHFEFLLAGPYHATYFPIAVEDM